MGIGFPHDYLIAGCGLRIPAFSLRLERGVIALRFKALRVFSQSAILAPVIAKPGKFSLDSVAA